MKARPILMKPEMVQATLREIEQEGTGKTQTRRMIKPQPLWQDARFSRIVCSTDLKRKDMNRWVVMKDSCTIDESRSSQPFKCPYGTVGDFLWVRESWQTLCDYDKINTSNIPTGASVQYPATYDGWVSKKRSSIFMPRWASRITLEITDIRVERLQDISEKDAIAEGVQNTIYWREERPASICYSLLWESINGEGSWDASPWVWVIEFKPHLMNVDDFLKKEELNNA